MFFLYHKKTRPTGKVLAKALGFRHFGIVAREADFLIRWGNAMPVRAGAEINSAQGISRASDKVRAFEAMKAAGVTIPWYTTSPQEASQRLTEGAVILGRTRSGSKGRGIVVYENLGAFFNYPRHDFYSEFVENDREYRLHVVGDKVVRLQRKYKEVEVDNPNRFIKNHEQGYRFKQPARPLREDRNELAVKAVRAVGLDFGAVDMVIDRAGVAWVLEVNTAPACSPLTAQAYINALVPLVEERSNGDYILHPNFAELEALRPVDEVPDFRNRIFLNG